MLIFFGIFFFYILSIQIEVDFMSEQAVENKEVGEIQREDNEGEGVKGVDMGHLQKIGDNAYAVFYESQKYIRLGQVRAGDKFQTTSGSYRHSEIIDHAWGSKIQAHNKVGQYISVLQPKSTLITETLARKTQILYSMDNSMILLKLNIVPGSRVIEAGTGSGSLSCAISEAIGENGTLFTFQFNKQRAEITKQFFENLGKKNIQANWRDVVSDGFRFEGMGDLADCLFLDVPNPWAAIQHAKIALKRNGRICCFSPCIEQVQRTCEELRRRRFKKIETVECLSREFQLQNKGQIVYEGLEGKKRMRSYSKAVHNNRGHTGFLTFAISC